MVFDPSTSSDEDCPFCNIGKHYPPFHPTSIEPSDLPSPSQDHSCSANAPNDPSGTAHTPDLRPTTTTPASFLVLSTPLLLAFLDILPLSPGHLLLTTRRHHLKISDVSAAEARALGEYLPLLSRVLSRVTQTPDWNIVQNNGAAAAQVVPHVHFHIIPRPALTPELRNRSFTMFGRGQRSELDDDEAEVLARDLRSELAREVRRLENEGRGGGSKGKL